MVWYGDEVSKEVRGHVARGMRKAVQLVVKDCKKRLNRSQPTRGYSSGRRVGLDPSKPFEPPKIVTSALKNSIKGKTERRARGVRGVVGTPLEKGRWLELGHRGGTRSGQGAMAPRPFLRPSVLENRKLILRTIARG